MKMAMAGGDFPQSRAVSHRDYERLDKAMSMAKQEALDLIKKMPESATTSDILDELYSKEQVDRGLRDVVEGRVISHKELKERLAQWRRSAGR